jgi:hypothetical protein
MSAFGDGLFLFAPNADASKPKLAAMKQIGTTRAAGLHDEGRAARAIFKKSISRPVFRSWIVPQRLRHVMSVVTTHPLALTASQP